MSINEGYIKVVPFSVFIESSSGKLAKVVKYLA